MDNVLRCNSLDCRRQLTDRALATTCSHIFCPECASRLGFGPNGDRNTCPACGIALSSPDSAVLNNLNPSEDYKTTVLSGMSPNTIMECAGRGFGFWAYQTTQEIVYQERVTKALTEKYANLSSYLDKVMAEANSEVAKLQNQVSSMSLDREALVRQNEELQKAFKDKSKTLLQTQELYDKLKKRAMMGQMEAAASDAVDSTLNAISQPHENVCREAHLAHQDQGFNAGLQDWGRPPQRPHFPNMAETPSSHRHRMGPTGVGIGLSAVPGIVSGTPATGQQHARNGYQSRGWSASVEGLGLSSAMRAGQGVRRAVVGGGFGRGNDREISRPNNNPYSQKFGGPGGGFTSTG